MFHSHKLAARAAVPALFPVDFIAHNHRVQTVAPPIVSFKYIPLVYKYN